MDDLVSNIRELVVRLAPVDRVAARGADDGVALDARGLGFDSVRLVELLLACEEGLGVALPADALPASDPLTVGAFIGWVVERAAKGRS